MKVSCLQENLAKGLSIVGRAAASRSTLPILSNILLTTDGEGRLKLSATNLEVGISCWIGASIEQEGSITIPARLLTDFVNSLPAERIDLVLDEPSQTLNLCCARFEANMKGIEGQAFPMVASFNEWDEEVTRLEPDALKLMIKQVAFAAASDEARPTLTGVRVECKNDTLVMTGTDGFRLSLKTIPLRQQAGNAFDVIVPALALIELAKVIGDHEDPIKVVVTKNQILFHFGNIDLVSQLLEGQYPNVTPIIPTKRGISTVLDTSRFLKATRVAYLFARDETNIIMVDITPENGDFEGGKVVLSAVSQELGDNISELDADVTSVDGESGKIAFNAKYLIDILDVFDGGYVVLETTHPASPGVLRCVGDDSFTHVLMPMIESSPHDSLDAIYARARKRQE